MGSPLPSNDRWPHKKRNRDRLGWGGSGLSLIFGKVIMWEFLSGKVDGKKC